MTRRGDGFMLEGLAIGGSIRQLPLEPLDLLPKGLPDLSRTPRLVETPYLCPACHRCKTMEIVFPFWHCLQCHARLIPADLLPRWPAYEPHADGSLFAAVA